MRVHLVNPSDLSFGTAVITPRWLFVLAAATPKVFGDPLIIDETLEHLVPESIAPGRRGGHRHPHRQRAARLRAGQDGARARRVGRLRRHPLHAVPRRGPRPRPGARRGPRRRRPRLGRACWPTAPRARRSRSTRADASKAMPSCRRAGTCCPPRNTCGARCRPCAAARSTARSARSGRPTARSHASAASTSSCARSSSCGGRASASSCWPTTTSIRCPGPICRWPSGGPTRPGSPS